ncbi:aconitate hydratase [Actinomycetospora soli]|uniref:aconitate hydratase n=1 Tax=Actinomycetospora soli TaxID=2893887 RepID=UPI001E5FA672|nr:aconitate hydratase [Actinomycetospora soli]MCD2187385.1 aconitate hydratase [Actinomycetospora soli]
MPDNLIRRILAAHLREGELTPGTEIVLDVDQVLIEDATGSMCALQFEELGVDRVAVSPSVMYVDHNVLQIDGRNMDEHRYLQTFAARYGLHFSRPGNGISHYVHLERFARPGALLLGADSHSTMSGAVGMVAFGAGGLDVAVAMAGHGVATTAPAVVNVELRGELPPWVAAKDVILELLRRHGVRGGQGRAYEFTGPGAAALSVLERGSICNMITELGALAAVFPADEQVRSWLRAQDREGDVTGVAADPDADYDEHEVIELGDLEPLIACPSSPGSVVPVREVAGTEVVQVCVGSSVNSSYEDLAIVGAVLRDEIVHPAIEMTVTPGSRQILDRVARGGVYGELVAAGARMLEPVCGPCIGVGQAPSPGKPSVRTFNRNFPGRSGTAGDEVYLCSPPTAAATALHGVITDPRDLGEVPAFDPPSTNPRRVDDQILVPLPDDEAVQVEVVRGPNIVSPPAGARVPDRLADPVLIVVGDDVSTGDMAPDGMGMSDWSNIPECARSMFARQDPGFHDRALAREHGVIVGGHNYGQGSSREQAAQAALYLGARAVIAASFARIHRANLIAQGIVPLEFVDAADLERAATDQTWTVEGLRDAVESGAEELTASTDVGELRLRLRLAPRERATLLAGGTIARLRGERQESSSSG